MRPCGMRSPAGLTPGRFPGARDPATLVAPMSSTGREGEGIPESPPEIPEATRRTWQEIVDIMAGIIGIPAALIMRITGPDIEVFVASGTEANPYRAGSRERLAGSGLYCERVIRTRERLLVPNALADEEWRANPDVKLNMISYLGFPVLWPDGSAFGTICVLDDKENAYSELFEKLILKFRDLVQAGLELIHMNRVLGDEKRRLSDYLTELRALRGIVPICASCKSIRDAEGAWHPVEHYLVRHPEAAFSHGVCPACMRKLYPEFTS